MWRAGQVVSGEVIALKEDGVFVQLMPHIEAFLPKEEIPTGEEQGSENLLWAGDQVMAAIVRVDPRNWEIF